MECRTDCICPRAERVRGAQESHRARFTFHNCRAEQTLWPTYCCQRDTPALSCAHQPLWVSCERVQAQLEAPAAVSAARAQIPSAASEATNGTSDHNKTGDMDACVVGTGMNPTQFTHAILITTMRMVVSPPT